MSAKVKSLKIKESQEFIKLVQQLEQGQSKNILSKFNFNNIYNTLC